MITQTKNRFFKPVMLLGVCCALAFSGAASAENKFLLSAQTGVALTNKSNFSDSNAIDVSAALRTNGFISRVGALVLPEFSHDDDYVNSYIEVRGLYVAASYGVDIGWGHVQAGGGVLVTNTLAYFAGKEVADESGSSPFVDARLTIPLTRFFGLEGSIKHISDVEGSDLNLVLIGAQFSF